MNWFRVFISILTLVPGLLLITSQGQAHGVIGKISRTETICVGATYDDGEPMSYAEVVVSDPEAKLDFQSGRTDRNGFFCFKPDSLGKWQLSVNDGMGHQLQLQPMVNQDMGLSQDSQTHKPINKATGIINGIALIIGLSGSLAWYRSRKNKGEIT